MRIRGWLTGLIVFLLAPSLVFATLWFNNRFENVNAIDRSLTGLHLIQSLGPLMQEKALTGQVQKSPDLLRLQLAEFGQAEMSGSLVESLDTFLEQKNVPSALREARSLASSISRLANLSAASSYETSRLPHLINDTLLSVVIESAVMVRNARNLTGREQINTWDKMLIPVQGGQFKVAADGASRETSTFFESLSGPGAESLRQQAQLYREANVAYQAQGAKLLSSAINAKTGADVVAEPVIAIQPEFVRSTFSLWQSALDYLNGDLHQQRAATLFTVALVGLISGLVIIAAFAIAIALTRALADRTQREFEDLGFHDPLTGLANRRALIKAIRALPKNDLDTQVGLIIFDLRHFKNINDRFGDQTGDAILREVAAQLTQFAEPEDFLGRTGGTEFMLLRPSVDDAAEFEKFACMVNRDFARERTINEQKTALETNAGVLISQPGDTITDQLLVDGALALRSAKQRGPRKYARFTAEMRTAFEKNGQIAKELLKAMNEGDIMPWFQPQIDIHTNEVVGAEALVRWVDHDHVRYPGSFLPAAVEAGYMERIEDTVRRDTLQLAAHLNGRTRRTIHFGLNVSANLLSNANAVEGLYNQVRETGLDPAVISLEILEAVMIDEVTATPIKENIARLSELGFFIELDDFGTGHSSISSLRDLKVDRVKIDRSFVSGVDTRPDLQKFTSALINLAKSLDISVLAEGVETEGERLWLAQNGCDVIQGFLISRAVPEQTLAALILKQNFLAPTGPSQSLKAVREL
ncbi:MAG: bifunctional diguanylate cyclase/phosphodiesterase [Roseibium sp.]|uniref:putative bifunctional diguanylate cyclase/phosphodiesterase n=1 Tax=Roseibium sp. TaxID=1936156 RepID=UPI00261917E5|nr:bifunctional diguanylate cyclase/phosphodiesterase [Roseibium sp.]MCV0427721.1 bifunctional diguanylate cyclase/phosphodiesterase [Roseibium sp.]